MLAAVQHTLLEGGQLIYVISASPLLHLNAPLQRRPGSVRCWSDLLAGAATISGELTDATFLLGVQGCVWRGRGGRSVVRTKIP